MLVRARVSRAGAGYERAGGGGGLRGAAGLDGGAGLVSVTAGGGGGAGMGVATTISDAMPHLVTTLWWVIVHSSVST